MDDWLLYEHDDGRHAVAPSAEAATFAHGDPAWHRVGPVEAPASTTGSAVQADESATTDQLIELAGALEQRRALAIVEAVTALATSYHDGSFCAGFETACEEITLRLRTEVWDGCLPPVDAPRESTDAPASGGSAVVPAGEEQAAPSQAQSIPATWQHDAGAYAQCHLCLRYTRNPDALSKSTFRCDCGSAEGWSGSFKPPGPDARWLGSDATASGAKGDSDA